MTPALVLIVEDAPAVREMLTRSISRWGYRVVSAPTAESAVDMMSVEPAHVVLCDISLPGQDGLWLAERLHELWPHTAVVMATGDTDVHAVLQSRRVGAVDYVVKPFAQAVLRQAVDRAAGRANFRPSVVRRNDSK